MNEIRSSRYKLWVQNRFGEGVMVLPEQQLLTISIRQSPHSHYIKRDDHDTMSQLIGEWLASLNKSGVPLAIQKDREQVIERWASGGARYISHKEYAVLQEFLSWTHQLNIEIVSVEIY